MMFGGGRPRSGSIDRARARPSSLERGRSRPNSLERERQSVRTARSSIIVIDNPGQRAPDVRSEKNKLITELITFLQKWGIDNPERFTVKALQCPSSKVFLEIFSFLLDNLMPGHSLATRYDEEIPFILKNFGYPHTIKKSAILSIAPHSWPQLCHALVWLTRCLAEMDDYNTPTTEFSTYCTEVCINPGQQEHFIREMTSSLLDEHRNTIVCLKEQLNGHTRKLDKIQSSENGDPQALLASIDDLEYDSKRVQQYISDTKKYLEPKDAQIAQIQTTQRSLEALLAEKTNRVKQLEVVYEQRSHEMTAEERQDMKAKVTACIDQRKQLQTDIEDTDRKKSDLEVKISQAIREVDELCRRFNNLAHDLMESSIANDLQLESISSVTDKVNNIVTPYLTKMEEDLVRDEVVIEKQTYRDQLSSDLKKIKSELDRIREKLRLSQARDNADILQLDKLSQELRKESDQLSYSLEVMSAERENLAKTRDQLQATESTTDSELNKLKHSHKEEEKRRLEKVKAAYDQWKTSERQRQILLRKQEIKLQGQLQEAQCLQIQLRALCDLMETME